MVRKATKKTKKSSSSTSKTDSLKEKDITDQTSDDMPESNQHGTGKRRGRPANSLKRSSEPTDSDKESEAKKLKRLELIDAFDALPHGVMLCLGTGEFGQLGLGENTTTRKKPALVAKDLEGKRIKKIVAGGMHTVCLTEDYQVYTFGCNDEGCLGRKISDDEEEFEPGLVAGALDGVRVVDISAGDSHTAALSEDGAVYLWGSFRDSHGKLGLVREYKMESAPTRLASLNRPIVKIASGGDHVAMITDNGKVYTMGCAEQGQLGRIARYFSNRGGRRTARVPGGEALRDKELCLHPNPIHMPRLNKASPLARDVFCGIYSTYIVTKSGDVFACGLNNYHQLGMPREEEDFFSPVHVPLLSGRPWKMFAGGMHHLILLDEKGDVYALGRGDYGMLGLGSNENASEPTKLPGLKNISRVGTGSTVSYAVGENGKAYAWGMGTNLQLTTGEEDDELSPVAMSGKNLEERAVLAVDGGGLHTVVLACDKSEFAKGGDS